MSTPMRGLIPMNGVRRTTWTAAAPACGDDLYSPVSPQRLHSGDIPRQGWAALKIHLNRYDNNLISYGGFLYGGEKISR